MSEKRGLNGGPHQYDDYGTVDKQPIIDQDELVSLFWCKQLTMPEPLVSVKIEVIMVMLNLYDRNLIDLYIVIRLTDVVLKSKFSSPESFIHS